MRTIIYDNVTQNSNEAGFQKLRKSNRVLAQSEEYFLQNMSIVYSILSLTLPENS